MPRQFPQASSPSLTLFLSKSPLAIFPMAPPTFSPLHTTTSLPPVPVFFPTAGSSIDQHRPPVYLPSPPVVLPIETPSMPFISFPSPTRILAKPPSSMNPLPKPRFASQMRPIFRPIKARAGVTRKCPRCGNSVPLLSLRSKSEAYCYCVCPALGSFSQLVWHCPLLICLKDDDGPEEFIHQGRFVWPDFCIPTSVLTAARRRSCSPWL